MAQCACPFRRCITGGLMMLASLWPVPARTATVLPPPVPAACDGVGEPGIVLADMPDLDAALPRLTRAFELAFNAEVAGRILASVDRATRLAVAAHPSRTATAPVATAPTPHALANPTFGARDTMAVSISPRLVPSGALNTDIRVLHSAGLLDAGFDLAAQKNLVTPDAMTMRYDGRALVKLGEALQFGVAARGSLGTLSAPTLAGDAYAGPLFRLNLVDRNIMLGSDFGYDFGLNPSNALSHAQFHAKLNLNLRL